MKTITEHLKTLPEPYSTLALRRVVPGTENRQYKTLRRALLSYCLSWGEGEENAFWDAVDNYAAGSRKDLPEIPAILLAELEPAPAAPACVFEVGKVYSRRDGVRRKVVAIDNHPSIPLIVVSIFPNGEGEEIPGTDFSRRRLNGKLSTGDDASDLIPPAPPKRVVALECADVPPGTVYRTPRASNPHAWGAILSSGKDGITSLSNANSVEDYTWQELMEDGTEILLPGTTVWQKCEKEVPA